MAGRVRPTYLGLPLGGMGSCTLLQWSTASGALAAAMLYGFWSRLSSASSSWTRASALTRASRSASARPCWSS